jgi:hypothetical protein
LHSTINTLTIWKKQPEIWAIEKTIVTAFMAVFSKSLRIVLGFRVGLRLKGIKKSGICQLAFVGQQCKGNYYDSHELTHVTYKVGKKYQGQSKMCHV